jgi:hypothetical protein
MAITQKRAKGRKHLRKGKKLEATKPLKAPGGGTQQYVKFDLNAPVISG